jgi:hypothetical protein
LLARVGVHSVGAISSRIDEFNANESCTSGQLSISGILDSGIVIDVLVRVGGSSVGLF